MSISEIERSTMSDDPIQSIKEPTSDLHRPDPEGQVPSPVDLEEQNTPPKSRVTNPFDDDYVSASDEISSKEEDIDQDERSTATPCDPTELFMEEHRECYRFGGEENSVNSMLDMMDTKDDPETRRKNQPSLRTKARRSLNKLKWNYGAPPVFLVGDKKTNNDNDDDHDDFTIGSFDCIALSSLREKLKLRTKIKNENDDDDEESMRSKPKSEDGKSQTTTVTITDESNGSITTSYPIRKRGSIYTTILACFLGFVLLLGIVILSYTLYALRQQEQDGEEVTVFAAEFWKEEVPKALAFWRDDDDGNGN